MSAAIPQTTDGDYTARELIGPTKVIRPFLNWPTQDLVTKIYERLYEIDRADYAPFARGNTLPNDGPADLADATAVIVSEGEPTLQSDGTQTVLCRFAHVPPPQTKPGSLMLTRPSIAGPFPKVLGAYRVFQPDGTVSSYDGYTAQTVASDSGLPAINPTGGTYTITFGASTTAALAYNATNATVQTALNGLASMAAFGTVTVTGTYTAGFVITFSAYATGSVTPSVTGSTGSTSTFTNVTPTVSGTVQFVSLRRSTIDAGTPSFNASGLSAPGGAYGGFAQFGDSFQISIGSFNGNGVTGTFTLTAFGQTTPAINFYGYDKAQMAGYIVAGIASLTNLAARGSLEVFIETLSGSTSPAMVAWIYVRPSITGGTYTLTALAQTTAALAYNASLSDIATALNALSNVTAVGGVTVTGSGYYTTSTGESAIDFSIVFADRPSFTASAASLTPSPCSITVTPTLRGTTQTLFLATANTDRFLGLPGHGFVTGDPLYFKQGASYVFGRTDYTIVAPDVIKVDARTSPFSAATLFTEVGKRTKRGYTSGSAPAPVTLTTQFSLSPIIPGPSKGEGDAFLLAIFSGDTAIPVRVGDEAPWPSDPSPINSLTTTYVDAAVL